MDNEELVNHFYTAFADGNVKGMLACYHEDVVFQETFTFVGVIRKFDGRLKITNRRCAQLLAQECNIYRIFFPVRQRCSLLSTNTTKYTVIKIINHIFVETSQKMKREHIGKVASTTIELVNFQTAGVKPRILRIGIYNGEIVFSR